MSLPTFLGIGAQKAGTTFLYELVRQHPDICVAHSRKEVHFFDKYYDRGVEWYESLFQYCDTPCRGEFTPAYLFQRHVPERIHSLVPDVKLIAILRNPIDRCYSQYKFTIREQNYQESFSEFMQYDQAAIARGLYHEQLTRYLRYFPREQLLVLIYEELIKHPEEQLVKVFNYLGIDATFKPTLQEVEKNSSQLPRLHKVYAAAKQTGSFLRDRDLYWVIEGAKKLGLKRIFFSNRQQKTVFPKISEEDRQFLKDFYADDLSQLSDLLGRDMQQFWRIERVVTPQIPVETH